ncbi:LacI family transcriptional regulator [Horticoccus luteus]|uniref:LacI family transcriptional regulator n=1 Tax=Horticoccus luteus TaxID=2862869 RepID=A0A8F9TTS0_9BACT|nr:LacI family DNA-binding transcriptional regulator [Horticoccus luteus]QYM78885.1 LacI family transcriptional regulator [Horticoccus luteus]
MTGRPIMEDIARAAGYSRAAVSLALRGHPSIPESTRRKIAAIAEQLGYRANPLVSALMSLQRQRRSMGGATTIAYLTSHPRSDPWRQRSYYVSMFRGAATRLEEIGCRLEEFSLQGEGMTPARLLQILRTRNIHGVIVAPLPYGETHVALDFSGLAVVGLGMSVHTPKIECVANDHFQSSALAVERCVALGYRRIGFVLSQESSRRLDHRWLGGYRFAVEQFGPGTRLPPLMTERQSELRAALPGWLRAHRPDVVILGNAEAELQEKIPTTVGLVSLGVDRADSATSGIFQDYELLGRVAGEHALAKLHTNSFGTLGEAHLHLVAGTWVAGRTTPGPRRRRAPAGATLT